MSNFYTNPQPTTNPPEPPGANIINPTGPINYPMRQRCQKMDTADLEALIREAGMELNRRKTERANKLIDKACTILNELQQMGVDFVVKDIDGNSIYVFDSCPIVKGQFRILEVEHNV